MSQFTPNQNTKTIQKEKPIENKQNEKGQLPTQKNTQKQNKIQDLFVYNFVTCFLSFNLACINAEPTSKRSNISFPDTY